jgi:hypothetical protein
MSGSRAGEKGLRELLARLRERLSHARAVDADSRKHLAAVVTDIDTELGRGGAASAHAPRLESLAVRFEADHPALAEVIREVMDALVKGGI